MQTSINIYLPHYEIPHPSPKYWVLWALSLLLTYSKPHFLIRLITIQVRSPKAKKLTGHSSSNNKSATFLWLNWVEFAPWGGKSFSGQPMTNTYILTYIVSQSGGSFRKKECRLEAPGGSLPRLVVTANWNFFFSLSSLQIILTQLLLLPA